MKLWIKFGLRRDEGDSSLSSSLVHAPAFDGFVSRWPKTLTVGRKSVNIREPIDSSRLQEMFAFLKEKAGKVPNWKRFPEFYNDPGRFQLRGEREFEKADLDAADYFVCVPLDFVVKGGCRLEGGRLSVKRSEIMRRIFGRALVSDFQLFCTEGFRERMEAEGFANLCFDPVEVSGNKPLEEPLWRILGQRPLLPVLNELVNDKGNPVTPGKSSDDSMHNGGEETQGQDGQGCWVNDLFFPPLLRYRRQELESVMGPFDLAHTNETWFSGPANSRPPMVVCSRKFRDWCSRQKQGRQKLAVEWWPVELVD